MVDRTPVGFLEAVVRIPIYAGDRMARTGPGDWWEYASPGVADGHLATTNRAVKEMSRRLLNASGNPVDSAEQLEGVRASD